MFLKNFSDSLILLIASWLSSSWIGYQLDVESVLFSTIFTITSLGICLTLMFRWRNQIKNGLNTNRIGKRMSSLAGWIILGIFLQILGIGVWVAMMVNDLDDNFGSKVLNLVDNPLTRFLIDIYGLRPRGITVLFFVLLAAMRLGGTFRQAQTASKKD
jgi:hypothetical protein